MTQNRKITFLGLFIWGLAILFYFYECFLRVYTNTIADNIMFDLKLNAQQFSLIGSAYFITYALMQVPVGILINRFGVKKLIVLACILCSFGVFWFSFSNSLFTAVISRLIMGFGSSFAFLSLLVLALNWFPRSQFGFFSGLSQFLGSIGPLLAGAPLALLLKRFEGDWKIIFLWLGFIGVFISFLFVLFIKNKPKTTEKIIFLTIPKKLKENYFSLLKKTQILWIILLLSISIVLFLFNSSLFRGDLK